MDNTTPLYVSDLHKSYSQTEVLIPMGAEHGDVNLIDESSGSGSARIDRVRSLAGTVFPSFNLWSHLTVLQNVMLGRISVLDRSEAEAGEKAESLLERVGILDWCNCYAVPFSGGQRQRTLPPRWRR